MIYLTALMFINEGKEDVFKTYEASVLPILKDYNGKLIYRIRPKEEDYIELEGERPFEIHFISFPSHEDFVNFTKDDKRKRFENLKIDSIKTSFIVKGETI